MQRQRKTDKDIKQRHLLLYLMDLISGVNNIEQKYKMNKKVKDLSKEQVN